MESNKTDASALLSSASRRFRSTTPTNDTCAGSTEPQKHKPVTPYSLHSNSRTSRIATNDFNLVDNVNEHLAVDIKATVTIDLDAWAHIAMDFNLKRAAGKKLRRGLWKKVERLFKAYQTATEGNPGNEPKLYPPFVKLLNSLASPVQNDNDKVFYVQHPTFVRGAHVEQAFDIGAVFEKLAAEDKNVASGMFWGLLLFIIEMKHQKGARLDFVSYTGDNPIKPKNLKRPRDDDAPVVASKESRKDEEGRGGKDSPATFSPSTSLSVTAYSTDTRAMLKQMERKGPEWTARQVGGYARDLLSNGMIRSHAIIAIVDDLVARLIFYDHSIIIQTKLIDLRDKQERIKFYRLVQRMHVLTPEQLGIVPNLSLDFMKDTKSLANALGNLPAQLKASEHEPPSHKILEGCLYHFVDEDNTKRIVRFGEILFRPSGIIGRGTIVVRVSCVCGQNLQCKCSWKKLRLVMKISFPSEGRTSEAKIIKHCTDKAKELQNEWVLDHLPKVLCSFTVPFDKDSPQTRLKAKIPGYEMREMRGTIQEELCPLKDLTDAKECAQVMYDVVQCHEWVYTDSRVLHRDISHGNIMFRRKSPDGPVYGVLNDFDLATMLDDPHPTPSSNHRTGTLPFMAHEQHADGWDGPLRFRHDLESLFYVMLLLTCHYSKPGVRARTLPYGEWYEAESISLWEKKATFLDHPWPSPPIQEFFRDFTPWLKRIKRFLAEGFDAFNTYKRQKMENMSEMEDISDLEDMSEMEDMSDMEMADWESQPVPSFDEETLNGKLSYKTFFNVMRIFRGHALQTRNPKLIRVRKST